MDIDRSKPTILVVSESATAHTGLGRVVKSIFTRLKATNKYNIVQLAQFHRPSTEPPPFDIIPTQGGEEDALGQKSFGQAVEKVRPNIVWGFGDPWGIGYIGNHIHRTRYDFIAYTCIDSEPIHPRYHGIFKSANKVVTFGEWPRRVLLQSCGVDSVVIPHGVDLNLFKPDERQRAQFRHMVTEGKDDKIVLGTVARNQPRKNLGVMFLIMQALVYGRYSICETCGRITTHKINHCTNSVIEEPSKCKWCWSDKIKHAEPTDKYVWYYHGSVFEKELKGMFWDMIALRDRYKLGRSVKYNLDHEGSLGVADHIMGCFYNLMDIFVLPTTCEGFGLPTMEAMACGVPVILPNYSAHVDWAGQGGELTEYDEYITESVQSTRAHISIEDTIRIILKMTDPVYRKELSSAAITTASKYNWDSIAKQWEEFFDAILHNSTITDASWHRSISI